MDGYDDKKAMSAVVKSMGDAARRAKAAKYGPKPKPAAVEVEEVEIKPGGEAPKAMPDLADPEELSRILESVLGK